MAQQPQKINKYSLTDLKNTTDDAIPYYLNSIGYRQIHTLTDVRLILGFSACLVAGGTFYYDYKYGFEASKILTCFTVVAYFVLNSLLTWWVWKVEAGTIYVGEKDEVKITLSSSVERHSPIYSLTVKSSGKDVTVPQTVEVKESFTSWFDEEGNLVPKPLQTFLDNSIPGLVAKKTLVKKEKE